MAVFLNNQFLENEHASLNIMDLSIQRGYAAFDYLRTVNGKPLFLENHLDRFYTSAEAMRLPLSKIKEELTEIINELIKKSGLSQAGIRLILTGGYSPDAYSLAEPNLLITCNPQTLPSVADFEKGISIITYEYQRDLPQVKNTNYMMAVWLQSIIKEKRADDVLYFKDNVLTEFPRANLFIVTKENVLVTPAENILLGVTRKKLIEISNDFIIVQEGNISKDELYEAKEVFMCSTTKRILPIIKADGIEISDGHPGEITRELYARFLSLES
ncbi:MAG TPA: aminotransferase class IV [Chitinophagaceae bacterium]|nr:aminotransferase class IV family protein [Chitinophagaceae bacterium]MBP6476177.1 aminotransferase class IV family protein [Chitinophagaceae bacterium]MBP7107190.1 aminotransferase class IV family protein [Chitinophagaceae bacterium]MBP7313608.1 aminotransferase class IV family protein [Chitinophagaceae bacterium]HQV54902.1 aminotransferase class IV [Chitinophagaceae bacterium]